MLKIRILLLIQVLSYSLMLTAQETDAHTFIKKDMNNMKFYEALTKLRQNRERFSADPMSLRTYLDAMACAFTFNGMVDSAIVSMDKMLFGGILREGKKRTDTVDFTGYAAVDAKSYVIDKARNYDVVMINEAHHVPRHRLFTKSLLRELYDAGYRYLCLEALHYEWNIEWNLGNYTGAIHNGYYTKESCFAELIREAAFAGYTIYGYEPKEITSLAGRDSMMAVYLNEIFQQDTAAKIIVHAGYGHISRNLPKSMYNYFVSATGKSVLTVDQTLFRERANDFYESVYNVAFNERFKVNSPTVLVDSSGKSFRRGDSDIYVYQPHTTLINNRPDWLYEQGNRQAVKVKGINRPSVIKAYYAHEVSISDTVPSRIFVPADAIVIEKLIKKQKHFLVLPKGIFLIQYHDMHGNIYKKYYCRVK